ncbi:MAG: hypothetical protein ACLQU3_09075 [Limisphaerales bacterium]
MNSRLNTRRADLGLPQFDLPPAEPVFPPNPVTELVITNTGGRITLKLRVPSPPAQYTLVQGARPVKTGVPCVQHFPFLGLATWSGAAFHLKDRDEFIGWDTEQCRRRRPLLANNSRLRVLPDWAVLEARISPRCTAKVKEIRSLMEALRAKVPEFRRRQALGYPIAGMVCLTVMAMATGVRKGPEDLAQFPPQAKTHLRAVKRERNRSRLEIRSLQCLEVTPSQVGFPGARLAARLETRVKRKGQWTREVVFLLSSLSLEQLQARGRLQLKRHYWVLEGRLHHCLDITMQEDPSRVRTPNSALVLGMIRRVVLSLSNAAVDKARRINPKSKFNTKSFRQRFLTARGGRERLRALILAKSPAVLDLDE